MKGQREEKSEKSEKEETGALREREGEICYCPLGLSSSSSSSPS